MINIIIIKLKSILGRALRTLTGQRYVRFTYSQISWPWSEFPESFTVFSVALRCIRKSANSESITTTKSRAFHLLLPLLPLHCFGDLTLVSSPLSFYHIYIFNTVCLWVLRSVWLWLLFCCAGTVFCWCTGTCSINTAGKYQEKYTSHWGGRGRGWCWGNFVTLRQKLQSNNKHLCN